ncbi:hypothetical protein [Georgenia wangjunii]|uniref:hypothetical protein n=1 Tax=Georgenia wangjunii TaxID=3117730 RepID=UPI002F26AB31
MTTDPHERQETAAPPSAGAHAQVYDPARYGSYDPAAPAGAADADGTAASPAPTAAGATEDAPPDGPVTGRARRRWPVVVLAVLLVLALGTGAYLLVLAREWSERAGELDSVAQGLGAELVQVKADLAESANALTTTQDQLTNAQERIAELADAVAQTGDDREVQRQVAAYQARISAAAATVARAMEDCVQGQEQLIVYLDDRESYDPAQLAEYRTQVSSFCAAAIEANDELQRQVEE